MQGSNRVAASLPLTTPPPSLLSVSVSRCVRLASTLGREPPLILRSGCKSHGRQSLLSPFEWPMGEGNTALSMSLLPSRRLPAAATAHACVHPPARLLVLVPTACGSLSSPSPRSRGTLPSPRSTKDVHPHVRCRPSNACHLPAARPSLPLSTRLPLSPADPAPSVALANSPLLSVFGPK